MTGFAIHRVCVAAKLTRHDYLSSNPAANFPKLVHSPTEIHCCAVPYLIQVVMSQPGATFSITSYGAWGRTYSNVQVLPGNSVKDRTD